MCRDVCEDGPVAAIAALQQILAEQSGRANAEAQAGGDGLVVTRRLAGPSVQRTERTEDGGSEAGGSNSGARQTSLQSRDHASKAVGAVQDSEQVTTLAAPEQLHLWLGDIRDVAL
ncbi:hypothetical protein [Streptomyces sp. G7(2002)]|uniref:hypothetical protein n=1 Tax=Streptomyces sp. G7(2002) TaxID=2971798 RepID=UPI00237D3867|nr:hypothetical protein [Streptomyces sp. G7(2002)]WDT53502.1 hypothetical protein NUT86_05270 [Streptomyces sp. G7(2002)]